MQRIDRRSFHHWTMAALGGMLAGAEQASGQTANTNQPPSPLLSDPHVCRGLNTCRGKGKGVMNACAGQGACATARSHTCHRGNDCRGQGGCGEKPGENTCRGRGACYVPLQPIIWTKARKRFEELMTKQGKAFGPAPPRAS